MNHKPMLLLCVDYGSMRVRVCVLVSGSFTLITETLLYCQHRMRFVPFMQVDHRWHK